MMYPVKVHNDALATLKQMKAFPVVDDASNIAAAENTKVIQKITKMFEAAEDPLRVELYTPYKAHTDKTKEVYALLKKMGDHYKTQIGLYMNSKEKEKAKSEYASVTAKSKLVGAVTDIHILIASLVEMNQAAWIPRLFEVNQTQLNILAELYPGGLPGMTTNTEYSAGIR